MPSAREAGDRHVRAYGAFAAAQSAAPEVCDYGVNTASERVQVSYLPWRAGISLSSGPVPGGQACERAAQELRAHRRRNRLRERQIRVIR